MKNKRFRRAYLCLFTVAFVMVSSPITNAVDPKETAVDAKFEVIDAYEAANMALDLVDMAKEDCKKSLNRYPSNVRALATTSGILQICNSIDSKILEARTKLSASPDAEALNGPELIERIDFYNSMTDLANQLAESIDILTITLEESQDFFVSIQELNASITKLKMSGNTAISELENRMSRAPKVVSNKVRTSIAYRKLIQLRGTIEVGAKRLDSVITFLPSINSLELLDSEYLRLELIKEGLPKESLVNELVEESAKSAPKYLCKKGSRYLVATKASKCAVGFVKVRVRF